MRKIMLVIILILNGIILFYACKKEIATEPLEYDTQTSSDNSLAEGIFNDINNIANQAIENGALSSYKRDDSQISILSLCADVTVNPDANGGGTIVVDFGHDKCYCLDGRFRKGVINISYTGAYRDSGTQIVTTFADYFVGRDSSKMFKVTGSKTVTNNGHNSSGNLNFTIVVDGHLTNGNGNTMNWVSTRNREWISGANTPLNWTDDEYVITGNASGTNFMGNSFSAVITHGLHVSSCSNITEGVFELTPSGKPTRTLDYGNGTCDALATVAVNGHTFNIILR